MWKLGFLGVVGAQYVLQDDRPGFTFELEFVAKAVVIPEAFEFRKRLLQWNGKSKRGYWLWMKKARSETGAKGRPLICWQAKSCY